MSTVALFGVSGRLGRYILSGLQSPTFRSSFAKIIVLQRKKPQAQQSLEGIEVRVFEEDTLEKSLEGVEVVVNAIGPAGHEFKDDLLKTIANLPDIRLYIPSEFGVDHTVHGFVHPEWDRKKHHYELAQKLIPHVRVCRIFVGLFLEESIGPWFGFHTAKDLYECIGSSATKVSFTSLVDAGLVVASVARMPQDLVPPQLHIGGDTLSVQDIASTMEASGSGNITIQEVPLARYKLNTLQESTKDPSKYLRFLMGEGNIKHDKTGLGNDNELVNPKESLWKWKTMQAYAEETQGKPWAEFHWNPEDIS